MTENNLEQINQTLKSNSIKSVLIIDDVFDPPPMRESFKDNLADYLKGGFLRKINPDYSDIVPDEQNLLNFLLGKHTVSGDFPAMIETLHDKLYQDYLRGNDIPEILRKFGVVKLDSAKVLQPLLKLLDNPDLGLELNKIATVSESDNISNKDFDIIFMDYIQDPSIGPDDPLTDEEIKTQIEKSTEILRKVLKKISCDTPSIILTSSHRKLEKTKKSYFDGLRGSVNAIQFDFVHKSWFEMKGKNITVRPQATRVLEKICNSLEIGRIVNKSINIWFRGAKRGIKSLKQDISSMELEDFAYLKRFRLNNEDVSFKDYLEWLFGEAMRSYVDEKVEWNDPCFEDIENDKLIQSIKGAQQSKLSPVSKIFYKIRVSDSKNRKRTRFCMGDLFTFNDKIRMVITPDCDLVIRKKSKKGYKGSMLTVGGDILEFEKIDSYIPEFVIIDSISKTINWKVKDITSHQFGDGRTKNFDLLKHNGDDYKYIGTLRPLFAKNIQDSVLSDLSRVALEVAPAVTIPAPVSAFVLNKKNKYEKLQSIDEAVVRVLFAVSKSHKTNEVHRIFFQTEYVENLLSWMVNHKDKSGIIKSSIDKILDDKDDFKKCMTETGLKVNKNSTKYGIYAIFKKNNNKKRHYWMKFVVDLSKTKVT